jgi:hypothetical protein
MRKLLGVAAAAATLGSLTGAALVAVPSAADPSGGVTVVAEGLDNPRQLTFGPGGLYVAEGGHGGDGPCFTAATGPVCAGTTGAITLVAPDGSTHRVVEGLPSFAAAGGGDATGPHGLTVNGGTVWATIGGPTTADRDALEQALPETGMLGQIGPVDVAGGGVVPSVDAWRFERDRNPDLDLGNPAIDSNAVDVLVDGPRVLFVDAGSNTLAVVGADGRVEPLSVFANRPVPNPVAPPGAPPVPMNAVPTAVERGRDGAYYVTQLTGFPFPVGGANVYRVDPATGTQSVFASGFTNLIDLAVDADGSLWVLEHDADGLLGPGTDGAIARITPGGAVQRLALAPGTLTHPAGITVGPDGALYVTNRATTAGAGQVLRIALTALA